MVTIRFSVVFFFFFKQKTAYEMRISDWSSDVCSSDLVGQASKAVNHLLGVLGAERRGADRLRFATREQRRTMRARQEADDRLNRANLLRIAPIDALTILQNGGANDFGLQLLDLLDGDHLHLRIFAGECFLRLCASGVQRIGTSRFAGQLVRSGDIRADKILELRLDRGMIIARGELDRKSTRLNSSH